MVIVCSGEEREKEIWRERKKGSRVYV